MEINRPVALIDPERCRNNILSFANKFDKLGISYRPHFKTHQSAEIGNWYRESGITKITVSSPSMAEYFINNGWNDITIAFPVTHIQFAYIQKLADRANITVFLNDPLSAQYYADNSLKLLNVFIEIDAGYNRSGVKAENTQLIDEIRKIIDQSAHLKFYGFYTHEGRTYHVKEKENVNHIIQSVIEKLNKLKSVFPGSAVCLGDTPSCSILNSFNGIDEVSPGNNIFFDCMQLNIGSCRETDIAMAIGCPVAQIKENENEVIIHGGAVHFSKERIKWKNILIYGLVFNINEESFGEVLADIYLKDISQEHGTIKGTPEWISGLRPGDTVYIFPVHSCLAANLFEHYQTIDGNRIEKRTLS